MCFALGQLAVGFKDNGSSSTPLSPFCQEITTSLLAVVRPSRLELPPAMIPMLEQYGCKQHEAAQHGALSGVASTCPTLAQCEALLIGNCPSADRHAMPV